MKKMGLTPELLELTRQKTRAAEDHLETLPAVVNRQVLVLLPRDKYLSWMAQWQTHRKIADENIDSEVARWHFARAYLISHVESEAQLAELIKRNRKYFLDAVVNGYAPKSLWPWVPKEEEFAEWFEVRLVGSQVWDLETNDLTKEPDWIAAIGLEF